MNTKRNIKQKSKKNIKQTKRNIKRNIKVKNIINKIYNKYLKNNIIITKIIYGGTNQLYLSHSEEESDIKDTIMYQSFKHINFFDNLYDNISKYIKEDNSNTTKKNIKWSSCIKECFINLKKLIDYEMNTTAYMLRILSNSLVGDIINNKLIFLLSNDVKNLTGIWKNDNKYFSLILKKEPLPLPLPLPKLQKEEDDIITQIEEKEDEGLEEKSRLIMVFGPSASGKSYFTDIIITLMKNTEIHKNIKFPNCFLTIDGDIYRKYSIIYQIIFSILKHKNLGFINLFSSFFTTKSLFTTNNIKRNIKDFLNKNKQKFSLYIPETLSSCSILTCYNNISSYIKITGDNNWIAVMIYQHKTSNDCIYSSNIYNNKELKLSCIGTSINGKKRELITGKKYSSLSWNISFNNSIKLIKKTPIRFLIHNSGGNNYSIIHNLSIDTYNSEEINKKIKDYLNKNNYKILYFNKQEIIPISYYK